MKNKLIVKKFIGYISEDSSYVKIETEGCVRQESIKDLAWCNYDCDFVEVSDFICDEDFKEFLNWFEKNQQRAVKGFLIRLGFDI